MRRAPAPPSDALFASTSRLLRLHLRTAWSSLLVWPMGMAALAYGTAWGQRQLYPTLDQRLVYEQTVGSSPASLAFNGRGHALSTLGGITAYEFGIFALTVIPAAALLVAITRTRAEEDKGRLDLVTAAPVGRLAPLSAAASAIGVGLLTAAVATAAGLAAAGLPWTGSLWYAATVWSGAALWAAVGLLCAEVSRSARTARQLGLALLGLAYGVRALVDARSWSATWVSPQGWLGEVQPFGDQRLGPLAAILGATLLVLIATVFVHDRRDLGAGLLAARPGPDDAPPWLCSPAALTWRLGRGPVLGWTLGVALWAALVGVLTPEMTTMVTANPQLATVLGGSAEQAEHIMASVGLQLTALLAACAGVAEVNRLATEERAGRIGLVLSTAVSRRRWSVTAVSAALGHALIALAAGGLAQGVGTALASGRGDGLDRLEPVGTTLAAAAAYAAPVALIVAVAVAALAWRPRGAALGWALSAWAMVVAFLAPTLHLPEATQQLSPPQHIGRPPVDDVRLAAVGVLTALTAALITAAVARLVHRDLAAG